MNKPIYEVRKIVNLKDMLNQSAEIHGDSPAFKFKTETPGEFRTISFKEFKNQVDSLGTALINMGLKDKSIAVISENRQEWTVCYLAAACGTGVVVPLDRSLPDNEIESLLIRSESECIFYSNNYNKIMKEIADKKSTNIKYFILMDDVGVAVNSDPDACKQVSLHKIMEEGKKLLEEGNRDFLDAEIDEEKMGFMLFTSGTTSISKAVMLSHRNICRDIMDIGSVIKIDERDTLLSFLPLHHTFECTVGFLYIVYAGGAIAYCDGVRHIADNIKEYNITAMISVPILFENMYKKVLKGIEKKGMLPKVEKGLKISNILRKVGIDLRAKLFKQIHESLGSDLRLFVSGGAALDPVVEKGYSDLGFTIFQGYGLTETSPVFASGNDKGTRIGSVGKVYPSFEVKIHEKDGNGIGEIAVKGPTVMLGYYNDQEATEDVLKDGWLYTGDLGYIDSAGFLFITGRKKNVIVLKNGKNIFPEELENVINRISIVKESFVYGKPDRDGDTKICAKIVYDSTVVKEELGEKTEEEVLDIVWKEVKAINKKMPAYKYIREVVATEEELIKTTTQKVKRHEELKKMLDV